MSDHDAEIATLLNGVRAGDERALADLLAEYRERLRRIVAFRLDARLLRRVSPSDVLQEAYIDAHKRLHYFQEDQEVPFFVWLRTVVIQRLIEVHRQHLGAQGRDVRRETSMDRDDSVQASPEKMAALMADITSPSVAIERMEVIERVRRGLERLAPFDREILALRHFEEMTNQEVASTLGISSPAASKRYLRALDRLRLFLESTGGPEGGDG